MKPNGNGLSGSGLKEIQYSSLPQKLGQVYCKPDLEIEVHFVPVERAIGLSTPARWTHTNAELAPGSSEGVRLGIKDIKSLLSEGS